MKPSPPEYSHLPLIALIGPTAVGKTALVLELAEALGAEVVSVDSMQVYRGLDIGTAKPTRSERARVPHHLLDLVDPDEEYNLSRFIDDAQRVCSEIAGRGRLPLLSGGTGLYLKGFQDGLFESSEGYLRTGDHIGPDAAEIRQQLRKQLSEEGRDVLHQRLRTLDSASADRVHPNDTNRLLRALEILMLTGKTWSEHLAGQRSGQESGATRRPILKIGLTASREWLYERIDRRAADMLAGGLIEEVESLLAKGYGPELKPMQAIGYRHTIAYLTGTADYAETLRLLARDTRRYAKRQMTWFAADPEIRWFSPDRGENIRQLIVNYLGNKH